MKAHTTPYRSAASVHTQLTASLTVLAVELIVATLIYLATNA